MENASFLGGYFEGAVVSDAMVITDMRTSVGTRDTSRSQARVLENNGEGNATIAATSQLR